MNKNKYTSEQVSTMRANPNIIKCSEKAITYATAFKVRAIKEYNENGKTANEIFRDAGFDLRVLGKEIPKSCLRGWRRIWQLKGVAGLTEEMRGRSSHGGGRPKTKWSSDAEKIKWLETEVAYLKAEKDFLAKLQAGREE